MDKTALSIATKNLRSCYGPRGIYAGLHQFKDYWSRDSFFASFGSLELGDYKIVKTNLELFIQNLSKTGQVPLRHGKSPLNIVLSYFKIPSKKRAIYVNDKNKKPTLDQNSLLIILCYYYYKYTKDITFLKNNYDQLKDAINWNFLFDLDDDKLIEESFYSNWADSIKKKGKVLYTNVCHCHALYCMSLISKDLKDKDNHIHYNTLYTAVRKKINELFWNGEHYIDWISKKKHYNYFSTDGNMLSILWGIAEKNKARHIEEAAHIFDIHDVPSQCVHPKYPSHLISTQTKLLGLSDYHNGLSWLWLGCINALAKHKIGMEKEAKELLERIGKIIIKHKVVYEVYEKNTKPVRRFIYRAENPFAWSAGLFIYCYYQIYKNKNK